MHTLHAEKNMSRVTIKDIAARLSVSPSTVSRALEDHPTISEKTKARVRELAEALNYTKNLRASSFRNRKSGLVALIVPEMNMYFIPELINGVNAAAEKNNVSVIVLQSDNSLEKEKKLLKYCLGLSIDGVLICLSEESENDDHIHEIIGDHIPVIMVDKIVDSESIGSVSIDDVETASKAADYLISMGHTQVLGLFGNPALSITKSRKKGFLEAYTKHGTLISSTLIREIPNILEFDLLVESAFQSDIKFSAVFCMSDELLMYAYHMILKSGLRIPEDCSLFAISDGIIPYALHPNISHIHHSGYEIGIRGLNLLTEALQNRPAPVTPIYLQTKLCEMDSVSRSF